MQLNLASWVMDSNAQLMQIIQAAGEHKVAVKTPEASLKLLQQTSSDEVAAEIIKELKRVSMKVKTSLTDAWAQCEATYADVKGLAVTADNAAETLEVFKTEPAERFKVAWTAWEKIESAPFEILSLLQASQKVSCEALKQDARTTMAGLCDVSVHMVDKAAVFRLIAVTLEALFGAPRGQSMADLISICQSVKKKIWRENGDEPVPLWVNSALAPKTSPKTSGKSRTPEIRIKEEPELPPA